jgi:hypothetical protein
LPLIITEAGLTHEHVEVSMPSNLKSDAQPQLALVMPARSELALKLAITVVPSLENWTPIKVGGGRGSERARTWTADPCEYTIT